MKQPIALSILLLPFCIQNHGRAMHKVNLPIWKNAVVQKGSPHRACITDGGGTNKIPCLRMSKEGKV